MAARGMGVGCRAGDMACIALGCPWGDDPGYPSADCGRKRKSWEWGAPCDMAVRLAAVGQAAAGLLLSEHLGSVVEHIEVFRRSVEQPRPKFVVNSDLYLLFRRISFPCFLFHRYCLNLQVAQSFHVLQSFVVLVGYSKEYNYRKY